MNYRELDSCGTKVSEFCFGTMRYASPDGVENEQSVLGERALHAALDLGVNFVHSSYEYGTRWLTGRALKSSPHRTSVHHMIKVNVPDWNEDGFSQDSFRSQVEVALEELHADQILVVQHLQRGVSRKEITSERGNEKRLAEFDRVSTELSEIVEILKREGKIQAVMSFPYTATYAERAVESDVYDGLVGYFNLLETELYRFLNTLSMKKKDFISIRALAGGMLTGGRVDREILDKNDRFAKPEYDSWYQRLQSLRQEIPLDPESWEKFAFQFSLGHSAIKSSVMGINSEKHLSFLGGTAPQVSSALLVQVAFLG